MAGDLNLSNLKPAQARKARKRVGRGLGSGKGRYSGRGIKGQKSRAGSHYMRAGFEGGQMPAYMRMGKQRGSTSKDAMPIGPFRTHSWSVNVRDLESRFKAGADVTPELLEGGRPDPEPQLRRQGARPRRPDGEALGLRPRVLEERGREDRGGRRQRHLAQAAARAEEAQAQEGCARSVDRGGCRRRGSRRASRRGRRRGRVRRRGTAEETRAADALVDRQRVAGARAPPPPALHRVRPRPLPPRELHPGAGRRLGPDQDVLRQPGRNGPRPARTCSRATPCRGSRSSRSGSCRTSPPRSSCSSGPWSSRPSPSCRRRASPATPRSTSTRAT